MSSQVVRVQGFTKGSLHGIGQEAERGNVEHRNADINPEHKHLNMAFKETEHGFYAEYNDIKTALNAQGKETKKGIAFEGMVITADKAFFEGKGWEQGKPMPPDMVKFFRDSYEWAKSEIGYQGTDKNIMSAVVHADETAPHLQLYYLPITEKWQEKIYAKGEDGKVLRTEKGTPIQAKDESGKTIYKQVENAEQPKLARSEFWRVRGGQTSYSQMQDRFHEQIGKGYGLERGEVGSDKVHRTKNQWEKQKLETEITPYRELKKGMTEAETPGKTVLPGVVAIKKKSLDALKEQAKAYSVNRGEIDNIRERERTVSVRERRADQRERQLDSREKKIEIRQQTVNEMYSQQANLNQLYEQEKESHAALQSEHEKVTASNRSLRSEITALRGEMDRVSTELREKLQSVTESLTERLRGAYESFASAVKAVGMLKWDNENGYRIDTLTKKQDRLIEAIGNYGAGWAEQDGFKDIAETMRTKIGISKGMEKEVKALEPKVQSLGHDR